MFGECSDSMPPLSSFLLDNEDQVVSVREEDQEQRYVDDVDDCWLTETQEEETSECEEVGVSEEESDDHLPDHWSSSLLLHLHSISCHYLSIRLYKQYEVIKIQVEDDDIQPQRGRHLKSIILTISDASSRRVRDVVEVSDDEVAYLEREDHKSCEETDIQ